MLALISHTLICAVPSATPEFNFSAYETNRLHNILTFVGDSFSLIHIMPCMQRV